MQWLQDDFHYLFGNKQMVILSRSDVTWDSSNASASFLCLSIPVRSTGSFIFSVYERINSEYSYYCFMMILNSKWYVKAVKKI